MEQIVIGFSAPRKWKIFAELIKFIYNTPYDHVYLEFNSTSLNRKLIYQASKTMVNFMGEGYFNDENIVFREFTIEIPSETKLKILQFCIDNAGKPYGWLDALGIGYVQVCSYIGIKVKNPFCRDYFCSKLIGEILEHYTYLDFDKKPENISPKDVYIVLDAIV